MIDPSTERLLTVAQVGELTGLSRAAIYVEMKERELPRPVRVGSKSVRWRLSELVAWMESRKKIPADIGR